jgi:putative ABC transport system permease protein
VLDRLQTGNAGATADATAAEDSVVLPMVDHGPRGLYLVRARPGQIGAAMAAASDVLRHANGQRIFGKLRPLSEVRAGAYERDRAMAISLGAICSILVFVTALGIAGLTGFWVERRKRQIGILHALGTRIAVLPDRECDALRRRCRVRCHCGLGVQCVARRLLWRTDHAVLVDCRQRHPHPRQVSASFPSTRAARVDPAKAIRACRAGPW